VKKKLSPTTPVDSAPPDAHPSIVTPSRILLVEEHPIACHGMAALINAEPDIVVCGMAHDFKTALKKYGALKPALIVLGLSLDERGGLDLLKEIRQQSPSERVLVLSRYEEVLFAAVAIRNGAAGYVMKEEDTGTLLAAIRTVLSGKTYLSRRLEKSLLVCSQRANYGAVLDPTQTLSAREFQVYSLIGKGYPTRAIAERLRIGVKTVETYRSKILSKLNLKNGAELLLHAVTMERQTSVNLEV
jgi:DNA-binding NarL/FixJ family response regulator